MIAINPVEKSPIFIVGVPRSGTTLLAAMLAAHSRLSCGPETRFFRFLSHTDKEQLYTAWPERAVDFLCSLVLIESVPEHYGLNREQLTTYLSTKEPSVSVVLAALTEQWMRQAGKQRWVEKSPEHLLHVDQIRTYFPSSPIIRIVRDARDAALSMNKTPWAPQDFLEALLFWYRYDKQSAHFFQHDKCCYTLRYEDLLRAPALELQRVCAFIRETYEERMLDTSRSASTVVTEKEIWKALAGQPMDKSRSQVWQKKLSQEQNCTAEALIGDRLLAYGYECTGQFERVAAVYPSLDKLLERRAVLHVLVQQRTRFWSLTRREEPHILLYIGHPDRDGWLRAKKPGRLLDAVRILVSILKGKFTHKRIYWIQDVNVDVRLGRSGRLLLRLFQLAGVSTKL